MSFTIPSCDDFIGEELVCLPTYGWGWCRTDLGHPVDFEQIVRASPFLIRVRGFTYSGGQPNGIYGEVEQAALLFSGLSFEGCIMHCGEFDFHQNLCRRVDMEIGPIPPAKHGSWMTEGSPRFYGSSIIAANIDVLESDPRTSNILASYRELQEGAG